MTDETTPMGDSDPAPPAVPPPPPPAAPPPPPAAPPPPPPAPPPPGAPGWAAPPPPPGAAPGAAPGAPATAPPPPGAPGWAPPPPPIPVAAIPQWRSLSGITNAITVFLGLAIAGAVFAIVAFANRISVTDDILHDRFDFGIVKRADDADDLVKAATAIYVLIAVVLVVLVIIWTFRAMKNNEALGRQFPRFKPGWGIAGWLIPFANLVIPVLILQDLWRGSDPRSPRGDTAWRSNKGSPLIGWYWAAFILSNGIRVGGTTRDDDEYTRRYFDDLKSQDSRFLAGSAIAIAAAVLGILMFRRIAQRQEECLRSQQQAWGV